MWEQLGNGTWLLREQELYEEFLGEFPNLRSKPFVRKAMARIAFQGGWTKLLVGQFDEGRRLLLASVKGDPTRIKAWLNLARAFLKIRPPRR